MYNANSKQYIFKQSNDKVWSFYYDEKLGLCYSTLTKRNTWTEGVTLQKNITLPFFIDMDGRDMFHIVFQNQKGNIFYSRLKDSEVNTLPLLNSRFPTAYDKHMRFVLGKNEAHFFYVLKHGEQPILSHQIIRDGHVGKPRVVDYVANVESPYSVVRDKRGDIYAFYGATEGNRQNFGCKKYSVDKDAWGTFNLLSPASQHLHSLADEKGAVHACFQSVADRQYELSYQKRHSGNEKWSEKAVIHTSPYSFDTASLICMEEKMIIFWIREGVVFYSGSENRGEQWSKPARYGFLPGRQLVCMSYRTNNPYEEGKIQCDNIPGVFSNGFKLAFYHTSGGATEGVPADEFRGVILDNIKNLKSDIEELRESNRALSDKVLSLAKVVKHLDRENIKQSIHLKMITGKGQTAKRVFDMYKTRWNKATVNKQLKNKKFKRG